jgi:hypothetical protein
MGTMDGLFSLGYCVYKSFSGQLEARHGVESTFMYSPNWYVFHIRLVNASDNHIGTS